MKVYDEYDTSTNQEMLNTIKTIVLSATGIEENVTRAYWALVVTWSNVQPVSTIATVRFVLGAKKSCLHFYRYTDFGFTALKISSSLEIAVIS